MPTAAKLVSALALALVALWGTLAYIPQLPEGADTGDLLPIMAVLGALVGWHSLGRSVGAARGQRAGLRAGRGYVEAMGHGLRATVLVVFWATLGFSTSTMLMRSTRQVYRGDPWLALMDVPRLMLDYGRLLVAQDVILALTVGGLCAGLVAEWSARRWS